MGTLPGARVTRFFPTHRRRQVECVQENFGRNKLARGLEEVTDLRDSHRAAGRTIHASGYRGALGLFWGWSLSTAALAGPTQP